MSEPHVIRLRGPWQLEPLDRWVACGSGEWRVETGDLPAGGKVAVPGDWRQLLGHDYLGRVRYSRAFNLPTNLGPREHVWLVLDEVDYQADVSLNGQFLGPVRPHHGAWRHEITATLRLHNQLVVDVQLPPEVHADPQLRGARAGQAGGLVGEVRLEIVAEATGV
jgi:beta-galactosidase/beta-glucuronidase